MQTGGVYRDHLERAPGSVRPTRPLPITALGMAALALLVALGGGATFYWFTETQAFALIAAAKLTSIAGVFLVAAFTSINLILRWLRWVFLLRRFHLRVPTRETFLIFFATLPAVLTPLYLGELLRVGLVARRHRALKPVVFWVWLVERCSDVATLLALWGMAIGQPALWGAGCAALLACPWLLARLTLRRSAAQQVHTGQLRPAMTVAVSATLSVSAWLLPAVAAHLLLRIFGAEVGLSSAVEAFARGTLLGACTGVPGGAGVVGSEMIVRLSDHGVDFSTATAAVALLRIATNWYAVALGLGIAVLFRSALAALVRAPRGVQQHFDALSPTYADDIPEHVRDRLLSRKIDAMMMSMPRRPPEQTPRGLDLGCGQGWYAARLAERGFQMTGVDVSRGQIEQAQAYCRSRNVDVGLSVYDGAHLPFADESFDFVYSINVLHHLVEPDAQRRLFGEVLRVLTSGGRFFLHEMNVENPLFRAYMSYFFPLLKSIDEGTELWLRPTRLPAVPGGRWCSDIAYFTFLPEFLPPIVQRTLEPLELMLERSSLRKYSAHYMAELRRV